MFKWLYRKVLRRKTPKEQLLQEAKKAWLCRRRKTPLEQLKQLLIEAKKDGDEETMGMLNARLAKYQIEEQRQKAIAFARRREARLKKAEQLFKELDR